MMPKMKRKTTIKDEPEHMSNDEGKLQILKMGVLMYNFSQRLDPTLKVYRLMKSIFKWEKPFLTVLFGCSLSFMVLYPKLSILFLSLFLVFGRHMILKKLEEFQVQQDVSKRILLPEENVVFLQNNMEKYCELFESVNTFLRDEDRTQLINIVRLLTKLGFLLILLELIFPLQALLLGLIWTMLVVFSPFRDKIFDIFMPKILLVNDYIDKFTFKIHESKLGKIISFNEIRKYTIIKQLYIYEYQRWWVGK